MKLIKTWFKLIKSWSILWYEQATSFQKSQISSHKIWNFELVRCAPLHSFRLNHNLPISDLASLLYYQLLSNPCVIICIHLQKHVPSDSSKNTCLTLFPGICSISQGLPNTISFHGMDETKHTRKRMTTKISIYLQLLQFLHDSTWFIAVRIRL